jgi:glycosyltransferase involved in cell wall biosynthesis
MLARLLKELGRQETAGLFTYSIVVADNDRLQSAAPAVSEFAAASPIPVRYCVEPRQGIAMARNAAMENATGDFVAFIDDDEFPVPGWLLTLFKTCGQFAVDGVLGPVKPHFDEEPPKWLVRGKFHERETYPTGLAVDWRNGRTGNLLFRRSIVTADSQAFRPEFLAGEDQDFFKRMIAKGHSFVWCDEAVAYEVIPPSRWTRSYLLRKALFQGSCLHPEFSARDTVTSIIAVSVYAAALPFALLAGHHWFMTLLVKGSHHLGKLLGVMDIQPFKGAYVTN